MTCFLWFHDWSKWSEWMDVSKNYKDGSKVEMSAQERTCERCGKKEWSQ